MKRFLVALLMAATMACSSVPKPVTQPVNVVSQTIRSVGHLTGTEDEQGMTVGYGCSAFSLAKRVFLTAAHCIGDNMKLDGRTVAVVAVDKPNDLALIVSDESMPSLKVRHEPLGLDEEVLAVGYGYNMTFATVTRHRVLAVKTTPDAKEIAPGSWFANGFIGGMSGGPVVDTTGQVVGIVQRGSSQVGYGVDSDTISKFLQSTVVILD